jgi:hypothetical protein
MIVLSFTAGCALLWSLCACAGAPAAVAGGPGAEDAERKAAAAVNAMNGGGGRNATSGGSSQASAGQTGGGAAGQTGGGIAGQTGGGAAGQTGGGARPAWIDSPDSVFARGSYVAAVGYSSDRNTAEKSALANLTALFGQSIQAELAAVTRYSEVVANGALVSVSDNSLTNAIKTSVQLDSLVGAEIRDYWYDGESTHYAVAVMERAKTSALYTDMIRSNETIITDLVNMSDAEKNSLDGYSRYILAATIADANRAFANVLAVVGTSNSGINTAGMRKGDDLRIEAAKITGNIPISVTVTGDRADRLKGAFAAVINKQGFRSGGVNSRYALNAVVTLAPVELPNQQNKFARYTVDANLVDTSTGGVLLPYAINGREGHISQPEAENRAIMAAERKINGEYGKLLSDYLGSLLPKKQ